MRLYVYNCSQQIQHFNYRVPEVPGLKSQVIEMGSQVMLGGEHLNALQIEAIVQQLENYGAVSMTEVHKAKHYTALLYSLDTPVNLNAMRHGAHHNNEVLVEQGKQIRTEAAVAVNNALEQNMRELQGAGGLTNLEMSVIEEKSGSLQSEDHVPVSEGVKVSKTVPASPGKRK